MSIRTSLMLGAAALAFGLFGAPEPASAQDCQDRLAQLENRIGTGGTTAQARTFAPGSATTPAEAAQGHAATADGSLATRTDLRAQLATARTLCLRGQDVQANAILSNIEAGAAAVIAPHLRPAAGTGGGGFNQRDDRLADQAGVAAAADDTIGDRPGVAEDAGQVGAAALGAGETLGGVNGLAGDQTDDREIADQQAADDSDGDQRAETAEGPTSDAEGEARTRDRRRGGAGVAESDSVDSGTGDRAAKDSAEGEGSAGESNGAANGEGSED